MKAFYSLHIKDLGDRFVLTAVELWNFYLIAAQVDGSNQNLVLPLSRFYLGTSLLVFFIKIRLHHYKYV